MRQLIGIWLGLLAAGLAPGAVALPPVPAPEVELFLSGSTAQDEALENLLRLASGLDGAPNLCEPGTLDVYRGRIGGTAKRVYYCRSGGSVAGVEGGVRLAVHKSSGGSGEGVAPLANGRPVQFLDLAALARPGACKSNRVVPARQDFASFTDHTDCGDVARSVVPTAGLSDIEPELVVPGVKGLVTRAQNQIIWGLPVTKNLRNALQAAQGLVRNTVPHDDPGRDREEVMPSLSRAQVAGILSGALSRWDQFVDSRGTPLPTSAALAPQPPASADAAGAAPGAYRPAPVTGNTIYVCRRIASSGTQASFELHYLRRRCVAGAPAFVSPDDGSDIERGGDAGRLVRVARPSGRVFAGIGSGDVRACLDAHEQFNRWAVGLLSTENRGNNGANEFRYIKVDGVAPTLLNAALGQWPHVSEQALQWRIDRDSEFSASRAGRVLEFIAANMGQPRVIRALNSGFVQPFGDGGYLAPGSSGFKTGPLPLTAESIRENPVSLVTKSLTKLNNCVDPISVGSTSF